MAWVFPSRASRACPIALIPYSISRRGWAFVGGFISQFTAVRGYSLHGLLVTPAAVASEVGVKLITLMASTGLFIEVVYLTFQDVLSFLRVPSRVIGQ